MSARTAAVHLDVREVAVVRQVAGLVLGYPDAELLDRLPLLRMVVGNLRGSVGGPLAGLLDHLAGTPAEQLTADYVATFDLNRRHALHLTYFTHGDTRKRGLALLRIKQTYRRFGFVLDDSELPDHLGKHPFHVSLLRYVGPHYHRLRIVGPHQLFHRGGLLRIASIVDGDIRAFTCKPHSDRVSDSR